MHPNANVAASRNLQSSTLPFFWMFPSTYGMTIGTIRSLATVAASDSAAPAARAPFQVPSSAISSCFVN